LRSPAPTLLVTIPDQLERANKLYARRNVEILAARPAPEGVDIPAMMRELAARGISKILLEGGAHLAAAVLHAKMVDRIAFFIAPKIFGAGTPAIEGLALNSVRDAIEVANLRATRIGTDWLLESELP
jgi:diaminohydroxyphosphoribosylaminopyrimidine deaminase/5-amino-6-(5-phosphoribosylamino)uracil reductase